jgi:hypothetical protein
VRRGCKKETTQRGLQGARGDGGAFGGEDSGRAIVGVWDPPDDDQHLEVGTDEASEFARGNKAPAVADTQKVIDDLHRKIGQLQVERDFLAGQPAISHLRRGGR